jgi:RNA polymerase sigma-70 factor (ECF subfamily)
MVTLQPTADAPGPSGELDEITLARAQKGERVAWAALVAHHQGAVFALISRILGRRRGSAAHEDLAQETFLRVFRALPTFERRGPARLSTWILTIASRLAISELRRRPVEYLLPVDVADPAAPDDGGAAWRVLARALEKAMGELAAPYRAAFVLRELHGLSHEEIARALDIPVGTVKSRLSRARQELASVLRDLEGGGKHG